MSAARIAKQVTCATVVALIALASPVGHAWSGYGQVSVRLLTVYQAGAGVAPGVLIELTTSPGDTEGCAHSNEGAAWIDWSRTGEPDGKAMYSSILAAHMAGRLVGIGLNGCSSGGYPVAYGVETPIWSDSC